MNRIVVVLLLSIAMSSQVLAHKGGCPGCAGERGHVLQDYIKTLLPTSVVNGFSKVAALRDVGELWTHCYGLWSSWNNGTLAFSLKDYFHAVELAGHTGNLFHRFGGIENTRLLLLLTAYNAYAVYAQVEDTLTNSVKESYGAQAAAMFGSVDGIFHALTTGSLIYSIWCPSCVDLKVKDL